MKVPASFLKVPGTFLKVPAFFLAGLILISGCASGLRRPDPAQMAFPYGTYQHKVNITPKFRKGINPIEVSGVVQSRQHDLRLVGLTPVGSTAFRIHEDLCEHKITKEFYIEELKKNEQHFEPLFQMIKAALFARKDTPDFMYHGAHIHLSEPDGQNIPRKIEIDHPQIEIEIDVTGYKAEPQYQAEPQHQAEP